MFRGWEKALCPGAGFILLLSAMFGVAVHALASPVYPPPAYVFASGAMQAAAPSLGARPESIQLPQPLSRVSPWVFRGLAALPAFAALLQE